MSLTIERKTAATTPPARKGATEHLTAKIEIKADTVNEERRTFQGLASTWALDFGGDKIRIGAYARTIDHWKTSGRVIPLIDLHAYDSVKKVVGKLIAAEETAEGLLCTFQLLKGEEGSPDADADAAWRRVKGGYVTGLSIGYRAVKYEYEQPEGTTDYWDRIRHLTEVELREVSLVIWGMNADALIDTDSAKGLAAAIREGGLTEEEKKELRALLADAPPAEVEAEAATAAAVEESAAPPVDEPEGLAPDDAARIRMDEMIRSLTMRSLEAG